MYESNVAALFQETSSTKVPLFVAAWGGSGLELSFIARPRGSLFSDGAEGLSVLVMRGIVPMPILCGPLQRKADQRRGPRPAWHL